MTVTLPFVILASFLQINVVLSVRLLTASEVKTSLNEVRASMTTQKALETLSHMPQTDAQLVALVQMKLGHRNLRQALKHGKNVTQSDSGGNSPTTTAGPTGYAAVDNAKKMLNDMLQETNMKMELDGVKCDEFENRQEVLMEGTRQDIALFNGQAAAARSEVLRAQTEINTVEIKLPEVHRNLIEHNLQCEMEIQALKYQLSIVEKDIKVMESVLNLTSCESTSSAASSAMLIQCQHCMSGKDYYMLKHTSISPILAKLKSNTTRQLIQQTLQSLYVQSSKPKKMSLAQMYDDPSALPEFPGALGVTNYPPNVLNTTDVPAIPPKPDCVMENKCTISESPNCKPLRDKFLAVHAGILELREELDLKLVETEKYCKETRENYESEIEELEQKYREEQTALATATEEQVEAEAQSHTSNQQHIDLEGEYHSTRKECCDDKNTYISEICALEKIRGELMKLEGTEVFITDCEVTDWIAQECPASCGGGQQTLTREISVWPNGGTPCPPLTMLRACNDEPCPVDCELEDWYGWSTCSAECGGGVKERTRNIKVQAQNSGEPCGATEDTVVCNPQACAKPCDLADWGEWGVCSKMCGTGVNTRLKAVAEPAIGDGFCEAEDSAERVGYKQCNTFDCGDLGDDTHPVLECSSKLDVIILLDGSGSLGPEGWEKSKKAAEMIVKSIDSGNNRVKLALQVFSGPTTFWDLEKCTTNHWQQPVDVENDCSVKWISHFTYDIASVQTAIEGMQWPEGTTLTSLAIAQASQELKYGRDKTNSVVIVITDGWPMYSSRTSRAATRLKGRGARLMFVPVGAGAPLEKVNEWASAPPENNVFEVKDLMDLDKVSTISGIIADICPVVKVYNKR